MKYYLALKRKEIMIHATTWMNFENIAKSNKLEEQMLRDSIYMKYLEWVNLYR